MTQNPSPTLYFGYGSNMWRDQMVRRCPDSKFLGIGLLVGWKWFICERGYANIKESRDHRVYGLIYEISESDETKLDGFEGVPYNYHKKELMINFLGNKTASMQMQLETLVYVDTERIHYGPPRTEYIPRMNSAIADALIEGVPEEYIKENLRPFIPEQWKTDN